MMNKCIVLLVGILLFSCKKKETICNCPTALVATFDNSISFPDSVYFGKNTLAMIDSTILVDSKTYGCGATLGKDATLSIVITNLSSIDIVTGQRPVWFYGTNTGWLAYNYNTTNNTQKFAAIQTGKLDMEILFSNYSIQGKCKIDFYENSSTITRTKYLKW